MNEDSKLVLLAIQQTLDENSELLKKIQSLPNNKNSVVENIQLDIEPISEALNQQFNNTATLLQSHLDSMNKVLNSNPLGNATINKNYSFIGVSTNSKISPRKMIVIFLILLFVFCTAWVSLNYWFNQGYKVKDQFSAYKTIQTIKYKSAKSYTKKEILNLYQDFQIGDTTKNNFYDKIELKIIQNKEIENKEKELNNLKNKK
jgi:hypothetical protein